MSIDLENLNSSFGDPYFGLTTEERERLIDQERREAEEIISRLPSPLPRTPLMKLAKGVLGLIDIVAIAIAGVITAGILWVTFLSALRFLWHLVLRGVQDMWYPTSARILLIIVISCFAWCLLRWRQIGIGPRERR